MQYIHISTKAKGKGERTMDSGQRSNRVQVAVCINKTAEKYKQYAKQTEDERPKRGHVKYTQCGTRGTGNKVNMLEHVAGNLASNGHKSLASAHIKHAACLP